MYDHGKSIVVFNVVQFIGVCSLFVVIIVNYVVRYYLRNVLAIRWDGKLKYYKQKLLFYEKITTCKMYSIYWTEMIWELFYSAIYEFSFFVHLEWIIIRKTMVKMPNIIEN